MSEEAIQCLIKIIGAIVFGIGMIAALFIWGWISDFVESSNQKSSVPDREVLRGRMRDRCRRERSKL